MLSALICLSLLPCQGHDDASRALLFALETYERSISSIYVEQRSFCPPASELKRETWELLETSVRYADRDGCYLHRSTMLNVDPPDFDPTYPVSIYLSDGNLLLGLDSSSGTGVLSQPDGFSAAGCHALRAMGWSADYDDSVHSRALHEMLSDAKHLTYMPPIEDEPWPGLRAQQPWTNAWGVLEVRLDPENGFAPRIVRCIREPDGLVAEQNFVIEFMTIDGISIPRIGFLSVNYIASLPPDGLPDSRRADMEAARKMLGLPEQLKSKSLALHIERLQQAVKGSASGTVQAPLSMLTPGEPLVSPQLFVVDRAVINQPQDFSLLTRQLPQDANIVVAPTGQKLKAQEVFEWWHGLSAAKDE